MEPDTSTQLDSSTPMGKVFHIEPEVLREITSGLDVLATYKVEEEKKPEEESERPKITVQTIDPQGTLKTISSVSAGRFGRPGSATTQTSTADSAFVRSKSSKDTRMSEWKRELYKEIVTWGYRRCEWTLGVFNTENLFRILCIHFDRAFWKVILDILFTLAFVILASCVDLDTLSARPTAFLQFTALPFKVFQYVQATWFASTAIAGNRKLIQRSSPGDSSKDRSRSFGTFDG